MRQELSQETNQETTTPPDHPFEHELTKLLNRYSKDTESNTPDFILSAYLCKCLQNWRESVAAREGYYGRKMG